MRRPLIFLILVLGLVAAACGDDEPARDTTGSITESGDASVFDLQVGDCFNDEAVATEVVTQVPVVPCSEPHDNEVFFEFSMTDAVFPGNEQAVAAGGLRCVDEFATYVGVAYADSELDLFPITPTADSWSNGDRVVYCALYAVDLSKLTGTMRGANR